VIIGNETGNILSTKIPIIDFENVIKIPGIIYFDIDKPLKLLNK